MIGDMTTSASPFTRPLVPFDGSEPSRAALRYAIAARNAGTQLTILTVVDDTPVFAESGTPYSAIDPTPMMNALDEQSAALLAEANALCRAAGITPNLETIREQPVAGILATIASQKNDVVIMGTHARNGVVRTFLGSTTAGILRTSPIPVLTLRNEDGLAAQPFATIVVAIDDSPPSDAAVAVAAAFAHTAQSSVVACGAFDTDTFYESASVYGFDVQRLTDDVREDTRRLVGHALKHAGFQPETPAEIVEGKAAPVILGVAAEHHATLVIAGTHGRRGLRRLFLGSVAEALVRTSVVPVLIVPAAAASATSTVPSAASSVRSSTANRQAVPV